MQSGLLDHLPFHLSTYLCVDTLKSEVYKATKPQDLKRNITEYINIIRSDTIFNVMHNFMIAT